MSADAALALSAKSIRLRRMVGDDHDGARHADDFYPTPPLATEALLRAESFTGDIWEPACGDGAISKVFEAAGHRVVSTDLVDRGYGEARVDFLMERRALAPNIVTNPPFKLASGFAAHALALGAVKVALLCRMTFLEGMERRALFDRAPPARVYAFSKRLTFARGEQATHGGGMLSFGWFIWDRAHSGPPTLGWI